MQVVRLSVRLSEKLAVGSGSRFHGIVRHQRCSGAFSVPVCYSCTFASNDWPRKLAVVSTHG